MGAPSTCRSRRRSPGQRRHAGPAAAAPRPRGHRHDRPLSGRRRRAPRAGAEGPVGAMSDPRVRYLGPLGLWLAVAVVISLIEGTPDRLPAVALGSSVLLHALRAGALFAIGFAVATVLTRAGAG